MRSTNWVESSADAKSISIELEATISSLLATCKLYMSISLTVRDWQSFPLAWKNYSRWKRKSLFFQGAF